MGFTLKPCVCVNLHILAEQVQILRAEMLGKFCSVDYLRINFT